MRALRDDLDALREDVVELREFRAAQGATQDALATDVTLLTDAVKKLQSAIDKSRGALWVIGVAASGLGAATGAIAAAMMHR
jgi:hypothetical protein